LFFLITNFQLFHQEEAHEILHAFLVGLRFDVSAICLINSTFIFFSLLPGSMWQRSWYQTALKWLFFLSNSPFLIMNMVDAEYFKFTGERSTSTLLDMKADIGAQLGQLIFHYWYLTTTAVLVITVFYYFIPKPPSVPVDKSSAARWIRESLVMAVVVGFVVVGARGGLQKKIISTVQADVFDGLSLSHLALNTSFTLIHSKPGCDSRTLPQSRFFSEEELKTQFAPPASARAGAERRDNVVIIIVESLSAQYTGMGEPTRGYTPFLD